MRSPEIPPHYAAAGVAGAGTIIVALLLNFNLAGGTADRAVRLRDAQTAVAVADEALMLAVIGAIVGVGVGMLIGGFWAYHSEVALR